jgi:type II secretory pathway pseudopilin PulG
MGVRARHVLRSSSGFTVLELVFVAALVALVSGMAMMITPAVLARAKSEGAAQTLVAHLRTAREQAISQRRNMQVTFSEGNRVQVLRVDVAPDPDTGLVVVSGTTPLVDARLEQGSVFIQFPGVPDTPDGFGAAQAVDFGAADAFTFTSEGTFVDQNGDELNGTILLGLPNRAETAQAVTVFGPTAYIRAWRWDGSRWVE